MTTHQNIKKSRAQLIKSSVLFLLLLSFFYFLSFFFQAPLSSQTYSRNSQSEFSQALLSQQALKNIEKYYYDDKRLNPKAMLKAGFNAIERMAPDILVDIPDSGQKISVMVGKEKEKFSLPKLSDFHDLESLTSVLQNVFSFIEKNYKGDVELAEMERSLLNAMVENLDPHSSLLSPKFFKEFRTQTEGEFGGLGIVVGLKDGELSVISPIEDTPAWRAGIKAKDKIVKIGNETTINMNLNEAVEKMRGKIGTQIVLQIQREGQVNRFDVTLTRALIKINSIQAKLINNSSEGDLGYIKIKSFQEDTFKELVKHLTSIRKQSKNFKGLILDLRNNPGGLLNQAVDVSDLFLKEGTIVSTVGGSNQMRDTLYAKNAQDEPDYPIAILVNEGSASASEIVAGALKNNNRAIVIGEQSFGKGSVQSVYNLRDSSALKLTIAQYLTPGNESIQSVGITPDIELVSASIAKDNVHMLSDHTFSEKDLDKHIISEFNQKHKPSYQISVFKAQEKNNNKEKEEESSDYNNLTKLNEDIDVQIAKRFLLAAKSSNRNTIIQDSKDLYKKISAEENQKIQTALSQLAVDWSDVKSSEKPQAQITFQIEGKGSSQVLKAGEESTLSLKVKNIGKGDFDQLIAQTDTDNVYLRNKEFVFGHIKSGEEKKWSTKVKIPESALSRQDEVKFVFTESNNNAPQSFNVILNSEALARPIYSYSYQIKNAANSNQISKGSPQKLLFKVSNIGTGLSKEAVISLKNLSGEGVAITQGRAKLGELLPNASKEAQLEFNIDTKYKSEKVELEVSIIDNSLQELFSNKIKMNLVKNEISPSPQKNITGPKLSILNLNELKSSHNKQIKLNSDISSDSPLQDVVVYSNENKVVLKTANQNEKTIHLEENIPLEKKNNLISIIARDVNGVSSYESFFVRKE